LYERGLNRKYFLPFVALIHTRFSNLALAAAADYRTLRPPNGAPAPPSAEACGAAEEGRVFAPRARGGFYHGASAGVSLRRAWGERLGSGAAPPPLQLEVGFGRQLRVARTAPGEAAWFEFAELCEARPGEPARGAPDFLALASAVRTVRSPRISAYLPISRVCSADGGPRRAEIARDRPRSPEIARDRPRSPEIARG